MKFPEQAPENWMEIINANISRLVIFMNSAEGGSLINKANMEYEYWDKVKYYSLPEGISTEFLWALIKLSRMGSLKQIPLKDVTGANFLYWLPGAVLKELSYIDKHNGELLLADRNDIPKRQKEKYLINSIMEEAIASSQLEGAATTREKAKEMLRSGKKPENESERMILNNYQTIMQLKEFVKDPLSPDIIKYIQKSLTEGTLEKAGDAGRYRTEDDQIQVIDRRDGELLFNPPPAQEIDERIMALCEFANAHPVDEFIHPVVKAIVIHFWLAYIHPFVDGNGRTARALFYWYLLKQGYWKFEYLAISRIIKEAPAQYARAYLYTEIDNRDLTYFLVFNLKIIHRAVERFEAYVENKQRQLSDIVLALRKYPGLNHRQYEVLRNTVSHPEARYFVGAHQKSFNIAYQTARTDLLDLAKKGFLVKRREGREFVFYPSEDILTKLRG